jgi:hypothetical protein
MKTVERTWRISLAAALMTTVWVATAPAADLPNTPAARPAQPATATPAPKASRPQHEPVLRLASARDCYVSSTCREHILLIIGVAY